MLKPEDRCKRCGDDSEYGHICPMEHQDIRDAKTAALVNKLADLQRQVRALREDARNITLDPEEVSLDARLNKIEAEIGTIGTIIIEARSEQ